MPIEWKLNAGTLLHMLVLIGTLIGLWIKARVRFEMVERELKQFKEDRKDIKEAFAQMSDTVHKMEIGQATLNTSVTHLADRLNHRSGRS